MRLCTVVMTEISGVTRRVYELEGSHESKEPMGSVPVGFGLNPRVGRAYLAFHPLLNALMASPSLPSIVLSMSFSLASSSLTGLPAALK